MPKVKIGQGDWVVVCDGAKALVLENVGDEVFPNLQTKAVYEQEDSKTSEQGTDAPGRAFGSVGEARSAVGQTDWHDQSERLFLEDLVGRLDSAVAAGQTRGLILVAPPRALGVLRQACTKTLREVLHGEIDKDFVKMPVHEIEKHLAG